MKKFIACLAFVVLVFIGQEISAQIKIGYVNTEYVISRMPEYDKMMNILAEKQKSLQAEGNLLLEDAKEKEQALNSKDTLTWSAEKKKVRKEAFLKLYERISNYQQEMEFELNKKQQELLEPIAETLDKAIKKVAKAKGYTYIFDSSKAGLVYAQESDNILELLEKELNLKPEPKENKPAATAAPAPAQNTNKSKN